MPRRVGNRHRPGYPAALRRFAVELLGAVCRRCGAREVARCQCPEPDRRPYTLTDVGLRCRNFMRVNFREAIDPVPRSTLRTWAKKAGLGPREPGRRRAAL